MADRLRDVRLRPLAGALVGVLLLAGSDSARAAPLEFEATLSLTHIRFLTAGNPLGTSGSFDHDGSGVGVSAKTPNRVTGFTEVSGFTGTGTSFVNGTFQPPTLWRFRVTGIGDADFSGAPLRGRMAVRGVLTLTTVTLVTQSNTFTFPLTQNGTAGLGLGGSLSWARFGEWTTGPVQLTGVATSFPGTQSTTLSQTGLDTRTTGGLGMVQLVTPIRIFSALGPDRGGFAVLALHFLPEPGQSLLLGSGFLALLGLHRLRGRGGAARGRRGH